MARVYLDTNKVLDIVIRNSTLLLELDVYEVFVSVLSIHILCYAGRLRVPHQELISLTKQFHLLDFTNSLLQNSLQGPTPDFEDNVQLHSATESDCEYFLTADKKLLQMRFFGKTQIVSSLP